MRKGGKSLSKFPYPSGNQLKFPGKLPEISEPVTEKLLQKARTWSQLSEDERKVAMELTVSEIVERYGVTERTARNWRAR